MKRSVLGLMILIVGVLVLSGCAQQVEESKYTGPVEKVTIADASQPIGGLLYVALENGYFKEESLEITILSYTSGKDSLDKGVLEGNADLATTAETPIVHASLRGEKISVVATIGTSKKNMAVVAKKDKGINTQTNLRGKTIAATTGTNGAFFLDNFLIFNDLKNEVDIVNKRPEEMFDVLVNDEVDAVTVWNPHLRKLKKELGNGGIYFSTEGIYKWTWNLAGKTEYVAKNPEVVKKVMKALRKAENFVKENPEESIRKVAKSIKTSEDNVRDDWDVLDLELTLEQSFLILLEDQARWAIQNKLTDTTEVPNYLDYIYLDALDEVKPEAVGIID